MRARSVPNSIAGLRQKRGLNENLAREILELHTLGVRTVYTPGRRHQLRQGDHRLDVASAARRIRSAAASSPSIRACTSRAPQTVIGKSYPDAGVEQGRAVLADLARHPATAKHVAHQARAPFRRRRAAAGAGRAARQALPRHRRRSQGDRQGAGRRAARPGTRRAASSSGRANGSSRALRAIGVTPPDIRPVMQAQNLLGEPLWRPPAPKGFADDSAAWLDGLVAAARRRQSARAPRRRRAPIRRRCSRRRSAPIASAETRQTIARAESRPQALALLLMAPEFQRR